MRLPWSTTSYLITILRPTPHPLPPKKKKKILCFQSLTEIFYSFSKFSLLGLYFLFPFFSLVNLKLSLCLSRHFLGVKEIQAFFSCVLAKRGSWSQVFLGETVETGVENCCVTDNIFRAPCMFCEEGLGKINAKDV